MLVTTYLVWERSSEIEFCIGCLVTYSGQKKTQTKLKKNYKEQQQQKHCTQKLVS